MFATLAQAMAAEPDRAQQDHQGRPRRADQVVTQGHQSCARCFLVAAVLLLQAAGDGVGFRPRLRQ